MIYKGFPLKVLHPDALNELVGVVVLASPTNIEPDETIMSFYLHERIENIFIGRGDGQVFDARTWLHNTWDSSWTWIPLFGDAGALDNLFERATNAYWEAAQRRLLVPAEVAQKLPQGRGLSTLDSLDALLYQRSLGELFEKELGRLCVCKEYLEDEPHDCASPRSAEHKEKE